MWFSENVRRVTKGEKNGGRQIEGRCQHVLGGPLWTQGPLGGAQRGSQEGPWGPKGQPKVAPESYGTLWPTYFQSKNLSAGVRGGE